MKIDEIGLVLEGIPLLSVKYYDSDHDKVDDICKSALISSLLQYAENVISSVEYFESNMYSMIFTKGKMNTARNSNESNIFSYLIIDSKKQLSEKKKRRMIQNLSHLLNEFIKRFDGVEISEVSQFEKFKSYIDETFGISSKSVDEKFSSLLTL